MSSQAPTIERPDGADERPRAGIFPLVSVALGAWLALATVGCGGSDSNNSPTPPVSIIRTDDGLVDVGDQVSLDGSESFDPTDQGLEYFWTLLPPSDSSAFYEDHCEDDPAVVCTMNDNNVCEVDEETPCVTNADCDEVGGEWSRLCDHALRIFSWSRQR